MRLKKCRTGFKALVLVLVVLGFRPNLLGQESCWAVDSSNALRPVFSFNLSCYKPVQSTELEDPSGLLALYLVKNGKTAPVPVTGSYKTFDGRLWLTPLVDLGEGLVFSLKSNLSSDTAGLLVYKTPFLTLPALDHPEVVKIFPERRAVPENILCFHVLFNQPMSQQQDAFRYVKVYHEGEEIPLIWKHTSTWTQNGKLLVLMIHPGRVKRGIAHRGKALSKGNIYRIVVGLDIKDSYGRKIAEEATKEFEIVDADYKVPKIKERHIEFPENRDRSPITLRFSEPMDYARLVNGIELHNENGIEVKHMVEHVNDKLYQFHPKDEWESGEYTLVLTHFVADLSGNQLDRKFEVRTKPNPDELETKRVLKFVVP